MTSWCPNTHCCHISTTIKKTGRKIYECSCCRVNNKFKIFLYKWDIKIIFHCIKNLTGPLSIKSVLWIFFECSQSRVLPLTSFKEEHTIYSFLSQIIHFNHMDSRKIYWHAGDLHALHNANNIPPTWKAFNKFCPWQQQYPHFEIHKLMTKYHPWHINPWSADEIPRYEHKRA